MATVPVTFTQPLTCQRWDKRLPRRGVIAGVQGSAFDGRDRHSFCGVQSSEGDINTHTVTGHWVNSIYSCLTYILARCLESVIHFRETL